MIGVTGKGIRLKDHDITIGYLADHPEWVDVIAGWFYEQWYDLYVNRSMTLENLKDRITGECNYDKVPLILVAVKDEKIVGTVGLNLHDMHTRKDLSPWLAGLYVDPEHRLKGIGSLLVEALIEKAKALDIGKLYLYTPDAEYLYDKLGWETLEQTEYFWPKVTIMEKSI